MKVTHHILACALACNGSGGAGGKFIAWALIVVVGGIGGSCWLFRYVRGQLTGQPIMSPRAAEFVSGRRIPSYVAPVNAVNPNRIRVHWARCCVTGHQTPEQAVAHAAGIAARIAVHGR